MKKIGIEIGIEIENFCFNRNRNRNRKKNWHRPITSKTLKIRSYIGFIKRKGKLLDSPFESKLKVDTSQSFVEASRKRRNKEIDFSGH